FYDQESNRGNGHRTGFGSETPRGVRPDINWRNFVELALIQLERLFVLKVKSACFLGASASRSMVRRTVQGRLAQVRPVGAGIAEVQVPGLVDGDRGGHGEIRHTREVDKAEIL